MIKFGKQKTEKYQVLELIKLEPICIPRISDILIIFEE